MMKNITISKKSLNLYLLFIFLVFPFFRYSYLTANYPITNKIYLLLQVFSFLIIVLLNIKNKQYKISKINIYIIIFLLILNISTIINGGSIFASAYLSFRIITLCLIVEYGIKYHTKIFLSAISSFLIFLVYTNFASIILFPKGMYIDSNVGYYQNWLLGYKNLHILFIMPAILFSFINSYIKYGKLKKSNYILLLVSILSIILANSSTSLVGLAIVLLFLVFNKMFDKISTLNIKNYFIFSIISFFGVIIFRIQDNFKFIIETILKRSVNFTNRTYIWDYVIEFIKEKPLLGYGVEDSFVRFNKTTMYQSFHAHNQILEVVYKGGFISLIIFLIIIVNSIKEVLKYKETKIAKFISIILFAYMIMMLTEVYSYEYFMFLFVICYNIKYILQGGKNESSS